MIDEKKLKLILDTYNATTYKNKTRWWEVRSGSKGLTVDVPELIDAFLTLSSELKDLQARWYDASMEAKNEYPEPERNEEGWDD